MFHKTIEFTSSQMLSGYLIPNLASPHEKVHVEFCFCFNERLKCGVVI